MYVWQSPQLFLPDLFVNWLNETASHDFAVLVVLFVPKVSPNPLIPAIGKLQSDADQRVSIVAFKAAIFLLVCLRGVALCARARWKP